MKRVCLADALKEWGGRSGVMVDLRRQRLWLWDTDGRARLSFLVSTARLGAGERMNSHRTPRGRHEVADRIGDGQPPNTVFVGRRPTGEVYTPALGSAHPGRDWILTRVLWLRGLEPGFNQGGDRDTMARYIYIHGAPDGTALGVPGSRGCVRVANDDAIALHDAVVVGTPVWIVEDLDGV